MALGVGVKIGIAVAAGVVTIVVISVIVVVATSGSDEGKMDKFGVKMGKGAVAVFLSRLLVDLET